MVFRNPPKFGDNRDCGNGNILFLAVVEQDSTCSLTSFITIYLRALFQSNLPKQFISKYLSQSNLPVWPRSKFAISKQYQNYQGRYLKDLWSNLSNQKFFFTFFIDNIRSIWDSRLPQLASLIKLWKYVRRVENLKSHTMNYRFQIFTYSTRLSKKLILPVFNCKIILDGFTYLVKW